MAAAAEQLNCAVSTVARRIDGLEQALGLVVLHRARGGATPSEAGLAILASIERAAEHLNQIPRQARNYQQFKSRRPVRLSATETVINDILLPRLPALRAANPHLLIEFESSNAISSLEFGQTDCAIRLAEPDQAELITRKLRPVPMAVFASTQQLDGRDPSELHLHSEDIAWIDSGLGDIHENRLIQQLGIGNRIILRATSVRALALACAQGQGLAMLPRYMGEDFGLIALEHIPIAARQGWLVYHPETRNDPTMRKLRRWVVECFDHKLAS